MDMDCWVWVLVCILVCVVWLRWPFLVGAAPHEKTTACCWGWGGLLLAAVVGALLVRDTTTGTAGIHHTRQTHSENTTLSKLRGKHSEETRVHRTAYTTRTRTTTQKKTTHLPSHSALCWRRRRRSSSSQEFRRFKCQCQQQQNPTTGLPTGDPE